MPKKNIKEAKFFKDAIKIINDMWLKGWNERNGGNLSYRLTSEEVLDYVPTDVLRHFKLTQEVKELSGEIFLVTGTGKFFRNVIIDPEDTLGIVQIANDGITLNLLWGYSNGGSPTSELASHLQSHAIRMKKTNGVDRVILHCHATNILSLTYTEPHDNKHWSKYLWKLSTESIIVFPDGVGLIPWMMPGSDELGIATAKCFNEYSAVIWVYHGMFVSGDTLDNAFGLLDTIEKVAQIWVKINSMGGIKPEQLITDENLLLLAKNFNVIPNKNILE